MCCITLFFTIKPYSICIYNLLISPMVKKISVLIVLLATLLLTFIPAKVSATAGQWSANGSNIYYNDGPVGLGTSTPATGFKLQTLGGTDSSVKYNQVRFEHVADRYWNIRTLQYQHGTYGSYALAFEQPANLYSGCTGCGGDLLFMPWRNVVMRSYNTGSTDFKLSVYGKVQAKEVLITTDSAYWPDYVFEDGYNLMSLKDLEKYIKENNHLPNVPSAEEIGANGLSVGEVQKAQMEKIEELTLHLIEKDKQIDDLNTRLEKLEALVMQK